MINLKERHRRMAVSTLIANSDRMKSPSYGQRCNRCGKNDHFAVKCLAGRRGEKSRADQKLHYVDKFDQCPFEEYTIDAVTHNAVENTKSYRKQLFTTVRVNNSKDVTFQDWGATCNFLPLKELSLEDPTDLYLKRTSATLGSRCTMDLLCIHLENALSGVPKVIYAMMLISLLFIRMSGHY